MNDSPSSNSIDTKTFSEKVNQELKDSTVYSRNFLDVTNESGRNVVEIPTSAFGLGTDQLTFEPKKLQEKLK